MLPQLTQMLLAACLLTQVWVCVSVSSAPLFGETMQTSGLVGSKPYILLRLDQPSDCYYLTAEPGNQAVTNSSQFPCIITAVVY